MKLLLVFVVYFFVSVAGISDSQRIAGGTTTTIANYPFAASLLSNHGSGSYELACGGTILTNNALLSAASCFFTNGTAHPPIWWRTRVGSTLSNSGGIIYLIRLITPHPNFSTSTRDNDVAILRTTLNIVYQPGSVEPARIAGGAYRFNNNQAVLAIGWGATSGTSTAPSEQLRQTQMWVVNERTCAERYADVNFNITSNMVCIGWLDVGVRGQCQGDGGSPLVDNGFVVGVFSWAQGCAQGRFPGINFRIPTYTNWIVSTALA